MNKEEKSTIIIVVLLFFVGLLLGIIIGGFIPVPTPEPVEPSETVEPVEPETTEAVETTEATEPLEPSEPIETEPDTEVPEVPVVKKELKTVTASVLNVREGPGVDYKVIDVLNRGASVYVLDNFGDWSKIEHNGGEAYVASDYLGDPSANNLAPGSVGSLSIPELGLAVDLYVPFTQEVVDRVNSAAVLFDDGYYNQTVIADHSNHGFSKIRKATAGKTEMVIHYTDKTVTYLCTKVFKGYNTEHDLVGLDYVSISGQNNGGVCLYTCNSEDPNETITLTFWQPK